MANNYANAAGANPKSTSDPGVFEELKQEAVEDVAEAATDAALKVAAGAKNIAERVPKAYHAAVEHPVEFSRFTVRSLERYIRHHPFEAMTIFSGFAFAVGGLWGLAQQKRQRPIPIQSYQVRAYEDVADGVARQAQHRRSLTDSTLGSAIETASDVVDRVSAFAREALDNPRRFARTTRDDVTRYTQDKPLQALGIAAGVAFMVGMLWKR